MSNMALSAKSEAFKRVPWFSLAEWHRVYNQIYSNDTLEQTKAYETLLVWKARIPKLPVGIECTLSLIQVCLRDREWTPKIDRAELPMYYENDLCLMYSTTIMRFLNQISNVGHTKQTSLFQIAKQLKIPEWIVNLRHDAAHGHELPAIGSLRMAANILLTWLHEEYWAAEAKAVEESYEKSIDNVDTEESCETQAFIVFIELWIAVGLYVKANYEFVDDLPDAELRDTLLNLCTVLPDSPIKRKIETDASRNFKNDNNYLLNDAQSILLSEISSLMSKKKSIRNIEDIVMKILFDSETFLPCQDIIGIFMSRDESALDWNENHLPIGMTNFWQNFIALLHEKKFIEELVLRLIELVNTNHEDTNKRLVASLWIKSICQAMIKLKITQSVAQTIEHSLDDKEKRMTSKYMIQKIRNRVNKTKPELSKAMWLNVASNVPEFFNDLHFATDILLNPNDFTTKYIHSILDLVNPALNPKQKDHLLRLVRIYTKSVISKDNECIDHENRTYCVDDLAKMCGRDWNEYQQKEFHENCVSECSFVEKFADRRIRNTEWKVAPGDYDWAGCAFGVLPWQTESLRMLEINVDVKPKPTTISTLSTIVPGLVDAKDLTMESRVNWDNVLRKKKRLKRKLHSGESEIMVDRAIQIVKKQQK